VSHAVKLRALSPETQEQPVTKKHAKGVDDLISANEGQTHNDGSCSGGLARYPSEIVRIFFKDTIKPFPMFKYSN
jgi:hypothetical protein